jgi:hypothetical protein
VTVARVQRSHDGHETTAAAPEPLVNEAPLPLYRRPGAVVIADESEEFIRQLRDSLPPSVHVEAFETAHFAAHHLQGQTSLCERDFWLHQGIVEGRHAGQNVIRAMLEYWRAESQRRSLARVCVVDHMVAHPGTLEVLHGLRSWPGSRVLKAGPAFNDVAVAAFNDGLIDRHVDSGSSQSATILADAVRALLALPNPRYDQIWRAALTGRQCATLDLYGVKDDIRSVIGATLVEWAVIGQPFGVLGIDAGDVAYWLQLEPRSELHDLAELTGEAGATPEEVEQVRRGLCVSDVELRQALGLGRGATVVPAFSIGREGRLVAALHRLDPLSGLRPGDWAAPRPIVRAENQSTY